MTVQSLYLTEAAEFLKMNPEVLRRKAKSGEIPGRKAGKHWIFIREHLADWVSGRYPEPRLDLQRGDGGAQPEKQACQSTKEAIRGGFKSPHQTDSEYNALLGLK
jgi:hypothetical protein